MSANRLGVSRRSIHAYLYATISIGVVALLLPRTPATPPLLLIALCIPLIFRLVPRNRFYGLRTPWTMNASEEAWYRHNMIAALVVTAASVAWVVVVALNRVRP